MLAGIGARERAGGPDGRACPPQMQSPQRSSFAWLTKRACGQERAQGERPEDTVTEQELQVQLEPLFFAFPRFRLTDEKVSGDADVCRLKAARAGWGAASELPGEG